MVSQRFVLCVALMSVVCSVHANIEVDSSRSPLQDLLAISTFGEFLDAWTEGFALLLKFVADLPNTVVERVTATGTYGTSLSWSVVGAYFVFVGLRFLLITIFPVFRSFSSLLYVWGSLGLWTVIHLLGGNFSSPHTADSVMQFETMLITVCVLVILLLNLSIALRNRTLHSAVQSVATLGIAVDLLVVRHDAGGAALAVPATVLSTCQVVCLGQALVALFAAPHENVPYRTVAAEEEEGGADEDAAYYNELVYATAKAIGLQAGEEHLYWIAANAVSTPLPEGWDVRETAKGELEYVELATKHAQEYSPVLEYYASFVQSLRDGHSAMYQIEKQVEKLDKLEGAGEVEADDAKADKVSAEVD